MSTLTNKKVQQLPKLTPLKAAWMERLTTEKNQLFNLFDKYPSPINIHHLSPYEDNYRKFKSIFEKYDVQYQVYFARKANKCQAFVKAAKELGFGVDTASVRELRQCLKLGCSAHKLVSTAAVKSPQLLQLALQHDVPVMFDNEDELATMDRLAQTMGRIPKIGIRISGFYFEGKKLYSRFGFDIDKVESLIINKFGIGNKYENLQVAGFHFHLNGYSTQQRGAAMIQSIAIVENLKAAGVTMKYIDMGGGILMNYLANRQEWETFNHELTESVQGFRAPITFQNNGLGYRLNEGQLEGKMAVYPYYNEIPQEVFVEEVLTYTDEQKRTVASLLRKNNLEIRIEPGRSMLDQTGMTVAKVIFRKKDSNGDLLVGLSMNRTQLCSSSADFLLDPLVIHQKSPTDKSLATSAYFVGAYCLEQDVILKRKIELQKVPEIGDLVCFFNTAGYMMHFYESEAHLFNLATNLVATDRTNGTDFYFQTNESYCQRNW